MLYQGLTMAMCGWMIDNSSIRVHQHGANGKSGRAGYRPRGVSLTTDACMGRSRDGLTTKIHALVDARGLPIALTLTPGQAHDGRSAADMLDTLGGGDVLLADRAYDSDALRLEMAARGAWANIKPMPGANAAAVQRLPLSLPQPRSNASSANSSTSGPSPPASTSTAKTTCSRQTRFSQIWMRFTSR
jgi:transposase